MDFGWIVERGALGPGSPIRYSEAGVWTFWVSAADVNSRCPSSRYKSAALTNPSDFPPFELVIEGGQITEPRWHDSVMLFVFEIGERVITGVAMVSPGLGACCLD